jgi:hypothetical protein
METSITQLNQEEKDLQNKLQEIQKKKKELSEKGQITARIKTFEDACKETGINPVFNESDTPDEIAYKKLKVIAKALNEGWEPNWDNEDEYKYYPYFDMRNNSFSFSDSYYWHSFTSVGSRLCYRSSKLAVYAGTQFNDLYKDLMVLK